MDLCCSVVILPSCKFHLPPLGGGQSCVFWVCCVPSWLAHICCFSVICAGTLADQLSLSAGPGEGHFLSLVWYWWPSHSALAVCSPGVLAWWRHPCNSLVTSVWAFPLGCEGTCGARVFPQRATPPPSPLRAMWSRAQSHCHWGRERRVPLPSSTSSGGSNTSTFRCIATWVSQMPFMLCKFPLLVYECPFHCILESRG